MEKKEVDFKKGSLTLDMIKEMFAKLYKEPPAKLRRYELPASYGASLTCDELKAFAKSDSWNFIGGYESITALRKRCDECGIK